MGIPDSVEKHPLRALCLSGGGIRSASFSIGFLQGLAEQRLIGHFDYLSGVSGGGYALGWWSALVHRRTKSLLSKAGQQENEPLAEGLNQTEELISTFFKPGSEQPPEDPFVRRYMRAHGNYLTVRTGLASPDTWAALVTIVRNLTYGLVGPGLAMVFAGLAILFVAGALAGAPYTYGAWLAVFSTVLAAVAWGLTAYRIHVARNDLVLHWNQLAPPWLLASACVLQAAFLLTPYSHFDQRSVAVAESTALASVWFMLVVDFLLVVGRMLGTAAHSTRKWSTFNLTLTALALMCVAVLWIPKTPYYAQVLMEGTLSLKQLGDDPRRIWLLWSLLVLSHAWEWVRDIFMQPEANFTNGKTDHLSEHRTARYALEFAADVASAICGAALAIALPWLAPTRQQVDNNWMFAGFLALLLATAAVLYSNLVIVSMGSYRRHRGDEGTTTEETMGREAWAQLWSKFILASFFLISALTLARAVQTLDSQKIQATMLVSLPLIALLTVVGLLRSHSQLINLALRVSGFAAVLGISLLALLAAQILKIEVDRIFNPIGEVLVFSCLWILFGYTLLNNGPNTFSMHELYRTRLVRAFLGASNEKGSVGPTGFCADDDLLLENLTVGAKEFTAVRPYPLWSAAVNVTASDEVGLQERKAASFIFSPLYCGYEVPKATRLKGRVNDVQAYAATSVHGLLKDIPVDKSDSLHELEPLTVGAAMATSGAAFSSNTGASTQPERALLLTLLGFRLGRWFPNPASVSNSTVRVRNVPKNAWTLGSTLYNEEQSTLFQVPHIIREALSQCDVKANAVYITDGGHFENLGVYEMIRRRAMLIVALDAGCDPNFEFADLMNLQQKVRSDFGVEIVVKGLDALRSSPDAFARRHIATWDVIYRPASAGLPAIVGKLIYCKSTLTGAEPADLLDYRKKVPSFPHLSTVNQWFAESTFEAYRTLGLVIGREAAALLAEHQVDSGIATKLEETA